MVFFCYNKCGENMKDENSKYLVLGYSEVYKQLYEVERIATFNDFENFYTPSYKIAINSDFVRKGVPLEYRKVILRKKTPFFIKGSLEEYMLGCSFNVTRDRYNNIKAVNQPIFYDNQCFYDKYMFSTGIDFVSYDYVISFLQKLKDNGYLRSYICALNSFFDMYFDVDKCFEIYGDEADVKKFVKGCRKRINR